MKNFLTLNRLKWFGASRMIGSVLSIAFVGVAGWWLVQTPPPPPEANLSFASTSVVASTDTVSRAPIVDVTPQTITV
ncbi:MAG: hypothetical protein ACKOBK_10720, partial [Acidimicrobiaceae bacterium]